MHQNRASPFPSDFLLQTQVSQGIPQWESIHSVVVAEKSLFARDLSSQGNRGTWGLKSRETVAGSGKSPPKSQRIARFWCTEVVSGELYTVLAFVLAIRVLQLTIEDFSLTMVICVSEHLNGL